MCISYKTITKKSNGVYKEKGSKFLSYSFPVKNEDEIKKIYSSIKKEHHSARHHCFAYRLGTVGNNYKAYDDNEPAYTAGKPILGQIDSFELTNILIIVVRYFGGTLLGKGGLMNAYKLASMDSLLKAEIVENKIKDYYQLICSYDNISKIMNVIKEMNVTIEKQEFKAECEMIIGIDKNMSEIFLHKTEYINNLNKKYLYTV